MSTVQIGGGNKVMKRVYSIDTLACQNGALSEKAKEMPGLATSMVLRCDDCIKIPIELSGSELLYIKQLLML